MKPTRISFCLAALLLAALTTAPLSRARADDMDSAAAQDLLTSAPWKITYGKGWDLIRVFDKDGTFYTPNRPDQAGRWKITGKMVVQTFADQRKDVFTFPINADGTAGIAKDSEEIKAVLQKGPIPPPPMAAQELDEEQKSATIAALVSAPWKITGLGWDRERIFNKNGTFTTTGHGDEQGHWKIVKNVITLTFQSDSHKDLLFLPLKPKETAGADENGGPMTAALGAPLPTPTPASAAPIAATPIVSPEDQRAANIALLTSAPWKIAGDGWADIRIFDKAGTFTTMDHGNESGHWRISGKQVVLTFADGHKDTVSLPLDAKGTPGTDQHGNPTTATLVSAPPASTPEQGKPSGTSPAYFGTGHQN